MRMWESRRKKNTSRFILQALSDRPAKEVAVDFNLVRCYGCSSSCISADSQEFPYSLFPINEGSQVTIWILVVALNKIRITERTEEAYPAQ